MPKVGGYILVDLPKLTITTGSSTPVDVPAETVIDLKQWNKPVVFTHMEATIDGGEVELGGFSAHTVMAGVHAHTLANIRISVSSDTQILVTTV